jgi:hypothetical protein
MLWVCRKEKMKENANEGARRTMDAMARDYGTDKGGQYHGYAALLAVLIQRRLFSRGSWN